MLTLDAAEHVHPEDWAALLQTNLYSATDVLGILYPEMVKRGQGEIVLISSCSAFSGFPYATPYAVSKAGMLGAIRSLEHEVRGTGVTLCLACPGYVETEIFKKSTHRTIEFPRFWEGILSMRLPFISAENAAQKIIAQVTRKKSIHVFPIPYRILTFLSQRFPLILTPFFKMLHRATK